MNYIKIYEQLIASAKNKEYISYTEQHHIIPRCMGGLDSKDNLVRLTPEEHYVAHQLLTRIYPTNHALSKAAAMMTVGRPSNKMYGWIRRRYSVAKSIEQSGTGNSQYGTKWIHDPLTKENKKIKGVLPDGWKYGKFKPSKIDKMAALKEKRNQNKLQQIKIYRKYYTIYKEVGFTTFVELTGYTKSKANLVQRFYYLLDEFIPQNGKKR